MQTGAPNKVCHIQLPDKASGNRKPEQSALTVPDEVLIDTLAGVH